MTVFVDNEGNISFYKGDTGNLTISGLPTDKAYTVYLAATDTETGQKVGSELSAAANQSPTVTLSLSATFTNAFTVGQGETSAIYNYGIKICNSASSTEDTLSPGVDTSGAKPLFSKPKTITVYPKYVEGLT